jgi:hypothetical protein
MSESLIYPNPNAGSFTLNTFLPRFDKTNVRIFDLTGKQVYTERVAIPGGMFSKTFDLNLPSGLYTLQIKGEQTNQSVRFVVD